MNIIFKLCYLSVRLQLQIVVPHRFVLGHFLTKQQYLRTCKIDLKLRIVLDLI